MLPMHVFLVGMSDSGKVNLGRRAASDLGLRFVDTDQRVGEMLGMSIEQIYSSLGEDFYHNAETGVLMELIDEFPCIVSTGSVLPMVKENVQLMQNHGIIIHVDRPLDQLLADARQGNSPTDHEEIVQEYNQRIGFYKACADYTFENNLGVQVGAQGITTLINSLF